ncbi:MAG: hypothetical protein JO016_19200 [Actinobacteria bacterium]|nr:hypothetical protein [Actinomycetota bacterium]
MPNTPQQSSSPRISRAAHPTATAAGRRGTPAPRRVYITASTAASTVAETAGTSAVQNPDSAK